ncbi:hypothetical protein MUG84_24635 [Paenibacillus sp. KQZ6P-2]|uniref:Uncharacterized protein n=1 Tax=Paenibacillus mangrovi TaxID=2931978 RepID=A0A9X1WUF1_9BACL|nr:hypothetical protein [Paenibacillus mangrovi]MCJ8014876.1 hypothetical protein [Paenibacillus mangrovi]
MNLSELWHHYEADKRIQGFSPNKMDKRIPKSFNGVRCYPSEDLMSDTKGKSIA